MSKQYYFEVGNLVHMFPDPTLAPGTRLPQEEGRRRHKGQLVEFLSLQPGTRIYTVLRKTSASGMQREISLYRVLDGRIQNIDWFVAGILGLPRKTGVAIRGCGMDMGFEMVYRLGEALWPAGTPTPHGKRNGEEDSTGGYALKQEWI